MEKKQKMRFSEKELSLIKNNLKDESILFTIRKVFLQMPLNSLDESNVKRMRGREIAGVIRKAFLPQLEADAPIQQNIDLLMTIELKDKSFPEKYENIIARELLIKYLEQQLVFIETGTEGEIKFDELGKIDKDKIEETSINLITRNTIIQHTEMQLFQFITLANMVDETLEEAAARTAKDSSK